MTDTTREAWLAERRKGIGGSDAAPALGLSKFKTQVELYYEKLGEYVPEQNEAMEWGTRLEPVVRQKYAEVMFLPVIQPPDLMRHPTYPWMLANIDGIVDAGSHSRVLECKTSRTGEGFGEPGTDEIPEDYRLQVQHYLCVAQLQVANIAVLVGASDFRIYEVEHDAELAEMLIDREAAFWTRVVDRMPPDPVSLQDCKLLWPRSMGNMLTANDEQIAAWQRLRELKALAKEAEKEIDDLKAAFMLSLGDADGLTGPEGKPIVTWKSKTETPKLDAKALREEEPEIAQRYMTLSKPSRVFLVK